MTVGENLANDDGNLFNGVLRKYGSRFVDLLLDIGQQKRVNPKMLKITSHLLIHGNLTQKEIKELTDLSIGTISTYLSVLLSTGRLIKTRIPGTHTYTYSFSGSLEDLGARGLQGALKSIENSASFLKNKKEDLKKLVAQSKKGAKHLANRIDEILGAFEAYKQIFADFKLEEKNF